MVVGCESDGGFGGFWVALFAVVPWSLPLYMSISVHRDDRPVSRAVRV